MKNRNLDHKDHWATPKEFYAVLDKEFHLVLSLDPASAPDIPKPSLPRKILNEILYVWYGSPFFGILEKVIKR